MPNSLEEVRHTQVVVARNLEEHNLEGHSLVEVELHNQEEVVDTSELVGSLEEVEDIPFAAGTELADCCDLCVMTLVDN